MKTNLNGMQAVPRASLIDAMLERAASWLDARNHLISSVMEETVTNRQMLLILHCGIAFLAMVGMAEVNLFGAIACFAWFGASLLQAKKGGLR